MKIAIIGSGISGLGISYLLNKYHDITVYEKNDYIGGHSRTIDIKIDDKIIPVDTGFIVFNHKNYPNLTKLFKHLKVKVTKSDMSFGVSIDNAWLEYGTKRKINLFAQKYNLLRIKFYKMLLDIWKFNYKSKKYLNSNLTLSECLYELGLGKWFCDYYLLPMSASIWNTPREGMLDFPVSPLIRFFNNHGFLNINKKTQWYTIEGGSKEYVKLLSLPFKDKVYLSLGVDKVVRKDNQVELTLSNSEIKIYDEVIFACHSNQAINILQNPTSDEKNVLGKINYQKNEMILHSDESFMQKRKKAWSSWVYLSQSKKDKNKKVSVSYWMNNLQTLNTSKPIIVTLNPTREPKFEYDRFTFYHPVFDKKSFKAQENLNKIQGVNKIWYTGAWTCYGFHEDGFLSAVNVAKKMGVNTPWN